MCTTKRKSRSPPVSQKSMQENNDSVINGAVQKKNASAKSDTECFTFGNIISFGVNTGAHRLWAHKCYKPNLAQRILLCLMQTCGCQNSVYEWCRDHRVHHKFTETDADPHNVKRAFFFSHFGWLLVKKHEDVKTKGKLVDMSDLEQDPVVMFHKGFFIPLNILCCFYMPYQLPVWLGESKMKEWNTVVTRYMLTLNFAWLVNSAAHMWGPKPYDDRIHAVENKFVSGMAVGGMHNLDNTLYDIITKP